jgi:hypothetical protein
MVTVTHHPLAIEPSGKWSFVDSPNMLVFLCRIHDISGIRDEFSAGYR